MISTDDFAAECRFWEIVLNQPSTLVGVTWDIFSVATYWVRERGMDGFLHVSGTPLGIEDDPGAASVCVVESGRPRTWYQIDRPVRLPWCQRPTHSGSQ